MIFQAISRTLLLFRYVAPDFLCPRTSWILWTTRRGNSFADLPRNGSEYPSYLENSRMSGLQSEANFSSPMTSDNLCGGRTSSVIATRSPQTKWWTLTFIGLHYMISAD